MGFALSVCEGCSSWRRKHRSVLWSFDHAHSSSVGGSRKTMASRHSVGRSPCSTPLLLSIPWPLGLHNMGLADGCGVNSAGLSPPVNPPLVARPIHLSRPATGTRPQRHPTRECAPRAWAQVLLCRCGIRLSVSLLEKDAPFGAMVVRPCCPIGTPPQRHPKRECAPRVESKSNFCRSFIQ